MPDCERAPAPITSRLHVGMIKAACGNVHLSYERVFLQEANVNSLHSRPARLAYNHGTADVQSANGEFRCGSGVNSATQTGGAGHALDYGRRIHRIAHHGSRNPYLASAIL